MAGDWIKMRCALPEDPAVLLMAAELAMDSYGVIGRLHRVWSWFDQQSRNGHAPVTLISHIDTLAGVTGFVDALKKARWLTVTNDEMVIPNFDRHNGQTAKQRALATKRKQKERVTKASRKSRDKSVTREEKRREDINTPIVPKGKRVCCALFDTFWSIYPAKVGKDKARPAWVRAVSRCVSRFDDSAAAEAFIVERAEAFSKSPVGQSGQYCPHPTTWLNGGRYDDDPATWNRTESAMAPRQPNGSPRVSSPEEFLKG